MSQAAATRSLLDLDEGFLALPRRLCASPFFQSLRADERFLFVAMLLAARYAEGGEFWFAGKRIPLAPGQFIDSEETLAAAAGSTRKVVRTGLRKLLEAGLILRSRVHPAGQCPTVTTIVDYERIRYAGGEAGQRTGQRTGQEGASDGPADGPTNGPHKNKGNKETKEPGEHGDKTRSPSPAAPTLHLEPVEERRPPKPAGKKKASTESVEPLRLRIIEFIRSTGTDYVDTSVVAERTNLRRALAAGATEDGIESAFRSVYARGGWHPRVQDVARVVTSASEKRGANAPAARGGAVAAMEPQAFTGTSGGFGS